MSLLVKGLINNYILNTSSGNVGVGNYHALLWNKKKKDKLKKIFGKLNIVVWKLSYRQWYLHTCIWGNKTCMKKEKKDLYHLIKTRVWKNRKSKILFCHFQSKKYFKDES